MRIAKNEISIDDLRSCQGQHLILTNFLDRLGEAANTHQRPGSRYAVNKLYTFIFNLIDEGRDD